MRMRQLLGLSVIAVLLGALATAVLLPGSSEAAEGIADEMLLVQPNGRWHIRQDGPQDYKFWYGERGDVPLFGDWDANGTDSPGMYRPSTGFAYLLYDIPPESSAPAADLEFYFGREE